MVISGYLEISVLVRCKTMVGTILVLRKAVYVLRKRPGRAMMRPAVVLAVWRPLYVIW